MLHLLQVVEAWTIVEDVYMLYLKNHLACNILTFLLVIFCGCCISFLSIECGCHRIDLILGFHYTNKISWLLNVCKCIDVGQ
jgi:hypothetical protein